MNLCWPDTVLQVYPGPSDLPVSSDLAALQTRAEPVLTSSGCRSSTSSLLGVLSALMRASTFRAGSGEPVSTESSDAVMVGNLLFPFHCCSPNSFITNALSAELLHPSGGPEVVRSVLQSWTCKSHLHFASHMSFLLVLLLLPVLHEDQL